MPALSRLHGGNCGPSFAVGDHAYADHSQDEGEGGARRRSLPSLSPRSPCYFSTHTPSSGSCSASSSWSCTRLGASSSGCSRRKRRRAHEGLAPTSAASRPIGEAWVRFDMRFYTMALIFIIFEVEAIFLFPWAAVYNDLVLRPGATGFGERASSPSSRCVFVLILGRRTGLRVEEGGHGLGQVHRGPLPAPSRAAAGHRAARRAPRRRSRTSPEELDRCLIGQRSIQEINFNTDAATRDNILDHQRRQGAQLDPQVVRLADDVRSGLLRHRDDGDGRLQLRHRPLRFGPLPRDAASGRPDDRGRHGVAEDGAPRQAALRADAGAEVRASRWAPAPSPAGPTSSTATTS